MSTSILHHFGIPSTALLGKGSESQIYALDPTRVVRIYPPGASLAALQARQHFYTQLAARHPPFMIPTVLDQGVIDDVAGAIVFLEVVEGYRAADTQLLLRSVQEGSEPVSADIIELYRLYYSLYFSHCKHDDPKTYAWCIQNLRTYAIEHLLDCDGER